MSDISFNKNLLYSKTGIFYDELEHLKAASTYLTPNNYVVSSYTDEDLNTSYALYWINEDQEIIPLTYNIKEGNGLYLQDNKWKLNIDNLSIKENNAYELYIDNEAIINAYGDMTKGVIKIDNDICHFNKYEVNNNNGTVLVNDNGNVSLSNRFLSLLDDLAFYKDNITNLTNEIDELIKITDEEMIFTLNVGDVIYYNEDKGYSKHLDSFDTDESWIPKYICVIASGILPDKKARIIDLRLDNYQSMPLGIDLSYDLSSLPAYQNIPLYTGQLDYDTDTNKTSINNTAIKYDGNIGYIATNSANWIDNYENPFYVNEHYGFTYIPEIPITNFKVLKLDIDTSETKNNLTTLCTYSLRLRDGDISDNPYYYNSHKYIIDNAYFDAGEDHIKVSDLKLIAYTDTGDFYPLQYPKNITSFYLDKYQIYNWRQVLTTQSWGNISEDIHEKDEQNNPIYNVVISNLHPHYGNPIDMQYGSRGINPYITLFGAKNTNILDEESLHSNILNNSNEIIYRAGVGTKYMYSCTVTVNFESSKNPAYFTGCDIEYRIRYGSTVESSITRIGQNISMTYSQPNVDQIDINDWRIELSSPINRTFTYSDVNLAARSTSQSEGTIDENLIINIYDYCTFTLDVNDAKLEFNDVQTNDIPQTRDTTNNIWPISERFSDWSQPTNVYRNIASIHYDITLANKETFVFNNELYYPLNNDKTVALKKKDSMEISHYSPSDSSSSNVTGFYGSYTIGENELTIITSNYTDSNGNINFINSISNNYPLGTFNNRTTNDNGWKYDNSGSSTHSYSVSVIDQSTINRTITGTNDTPAYTYLFKINNDTNLAKINLGSAVRTPKEMPIKITINYNWKKGSCYYKAYQTVYGIFVCDNTATNNSTCGWIYRADAGDTGWYSFVLNDTIQLILTENTPYQYITSIEFRTLNK